MISDEGMGLVLAENRLSYDASIMYAQAIVIAAGHVSC
jgi:hypothetical protein